MVNCIKTTGGAEIMVEVGYRHKPGQNFHGKKNKRRALNIKFGLDKVL